MKTPESPQNVIDHRPWKEGNYGFEAALMQNCHILKTNSVEYLCAMVGVYSIEEYSIYGVARVTPHARKRGVKTSLGITVV